jgi:hypothetical protein
MHAWGKIKKPYKELMAILLSSPMHVLLCGRQGTEYATDDETDEIKAVGVKMKAEGETPYEPHILIRMESERKKGKGEGTIAAFVEKDRTGVLAGKVFQMPTFDMLCAPILPLLGGTQARVPTEDETAATDAVALSDADRAKQERSEQLYRDAAAMFDLAKTPEELEKSSKNVTKDMKSEMVPAHVTQLREKYLERSKALGNVA